MSESRYSSVILHKETGLHGARDLTGSRIIISEYRRWAGSGFSPPGYYAQQPYTGKMERYPYIARVL